MPSLAQAAVYKALGQKVSDRLHNKLIRRIDASAIINGQRISFSRKVGPRYINFAFYPFATFAEARGTSEYDDSDFVWTIISIVCMKRPPQGIINFHCMSYWPAIIAMVKKGSHK